jgi:YD repeat-containing protein
MGRTITLAGGIGHARVQPTDKAYVALLREADRLFNDRSLESSETATLAKARFYRLTFRPLDAAEAYESLFRHVRATRQILRESYIYGEAAAILWRNGYPPEIVRDHCAHAAAEMENYKLQVNRNSNSGGNNVITSVQLMHGTNSIGAAINYGYNANNDQLTSVTDQMDALNGGAMTAPHWHYVYDASGDEIEQVDAKGNITHFAYDENGNEVSRTLPGGQEETFTYNQLGQVATHKDFDGNVATYTYYSTYGGGAYVGAVESVVYTAATGSGKANQTVSYTYDDMGRALTVTDASGTTTDYYDNQGNLIEQDTPEGTIYYVFDPATGYHTETYTSNTDTVYGYNAQGELTTVTVKKLNGNVLSTPLVTSYTYDPAGNLLTESDPNGVVTTYTYDDLNRLVNLTEAKGSATLFGEAYTLNDDGTKASSSESELQATISTAWGYDADGRLASEVIASSLSGQSESTTWSYDLNGNRTKQVKVAGSTTDTTTSTYNGDGELTQSVDSATGTTTFTYDANGSQLTSTNNGQTTADSYDVRNQLSSVATGGITTSYGYDDSGNRISETVNGTTTYYLIDSSNPTGYAKPIEVHVGSPTAAPSTTYLLGLRVIGQVSASGVVTYLLVDGQDNTRAVANAAGAVTATFNYDAFGDPLGFDPATAPTSILFQQMMYDPASGLNFTDSRQEGLGDPNFIESDAQGYSSNGNPITLNAYLFGSADPLMFTDPSGHDSLAELSVVTAIQNLIASAYVGAGAGTSAAARAVAAGYTVGQAMAMFALDSVEGLVLGVAYLKALSVAAGASDLTLITADGPEINAGSLPEVTEEIVSADSSQPQPVLRQIDRVPQDINVNADPPPIKGNYANRAIGKNAAQNAALQTYVQWAIDNEAQDIRINQQQVNAQGVRVGVNQPDLQFTVNGKRWYIEWDTLSSGRGLGHGERIIANDPQGQVLLFKLQ